MTETELDSEHGWGHRGWSVESDCCDHRITLYRDGQLSVDNNILLHWRAGHREYEDNNVATPCKYLLILLFAENKCC